MSKSRRQGKNLFFLLFILVFSALCFVGYLLYLWYKSETLRYSEYPEFGITIPYGYAIHGIDVSKYQGVISWKQVQEMEVEGIKMHFAFIKATEGVRLTDPFYKKNWKKSKDAGLKRGAYHFFIPSADAKTQARHFIDKVDLSPGDLPPVLDVEQKGRTKAADLRQRVAEWLRIVEARYGVKPIIYTNADFYTNYLSPQFDDYPLWVAHYLERDNPRVAREWSFWQHSEKGRVNGILSAVDFNVFRGDSAKFNSLLIQPGVE